MKKSKGNRWNHKEIQRSNARGMIAQKSLPHMRWRFPASCHIFGNRGLTRIDAELEEFAMDPRSAPKRVGEAHIPDQLTNFERDLRSAAARARLPAPEPAKPGPMPADDRLRLDDHRGVQNAGCKPIEARKNEPIKIAENKPLWRFSLQNIELVAKRQDLRFERGSRPKKSGHYPLSLSMSPIRQSIARFAVSCQRDRVYGRDNGSERYERLSLDKRISAASRYLYWARNPEPSVHCQWRRQIVPNGGKKVYQPG
jgi:hypothetical protein